MKTIVALLALLVYFGAQAQEKKEKRALSLEWELFSVNANREGMSVQIETPDYIKTVPIHPDDPFGGRLIRLPDKSPSAQFINNSYLNISTLKLWLFSAIGVGIGIRIPNSTNFGVVDSNYAKLLGPNWGDVFVHYYFSDTKSGKLLGGWMRFLVEMKSSSLCIVRQNKEQERWEINVFVGYEPQIYYSNLYAKNGWNRFEEFKEYQSYKLGSIKTGLGYAGINIQGKDLTIDDNSAMSLGKIRFQGIRLYVMQPVTSYEITDAGKEAEISFSGKPPLMF
jgi:hypothetical protein